MFKNKLLRALLMPFVTYIGDPDAGGGNVGTEGGGEPGDGGIDIGAAADKIGEDLFGSSTDEPNNPEPTPAPDAAPAPTPAPTAAPAPAAKFTAPTTWRPEAAAAWAGLPEQVQQEIVKREEDMFKGIEGYKADAAIGKTFAQVLAPYQQVLARTQESPAQLMQGFLGAHTQLTFGTPQQKLETVHKIAQLYGIDLTPQDPDNQPYTDPQVKGLQEKIAALESQLSGYGQQQQQLRQAEETRLRAQLSSEIDAFAADPANIYFNEVANDIAQLLQSGVAKDLKDAYEQAIWRNPAVRAKELDRQTAERAAKEQAAAQERAEKARKSTAANVRTSAKQGGGTAPLGSIDDTLREAFATIKSRKE